MIPRRVWQHWGLAWCCSHSKSNRCARAHLVEVSGKTEHRLRTPLSRGRLTSNSISAQRLAVSLTLPDKQRVPHPRPTPQLPYLRPTYLLRFFFRQPGGSLGGSNRPAVAPNRILTLTAVDSAAGWPLPGSLPTFDGALPFAPHILIDRGRVAARLVARGSALTAPVCTARTCTHAACHACAHVRAAAEHGQGAAGRSRT